ncbi:MAG: SpoIIE family protein phosphatase [Clostridia bacterium]|nr:SpoIIE family protein phosphatase [Clostridia bacterium]
MKKLDFKKIKTFTFIFIAFCLLSFTKKYGYSSLALPTYIALLYNGFPALILFIFYQLANLVVFEPISILLEFISSLIITLIFILYKNKRPRLELAIYVIIALCPFIYNGITLQKAVYMLLSTLFTFISIVAVKVLFINKFRYALTLEEVTSLSIFICFISFGIISLLSYSVYKAVAVFLVLLSCYLLDSYGLIASCVLSLPLCVSDLSIEPLGIFMLYSMAILVSIKYSRLLSSTLVLGIEMAILYLTNIYNDYNYLQLSLFISAVFLFAFLPKSYAQSIKEKIFKFKDKKLPKVAINRMRTSLSASLYEVSCALVDMQTSIKNIKSLTLSEEQIKENIITCVVEEVCLTCPLKNTCHQKRFPSYEILIKLATIGIARGKITLIDLPIEFSKNCSFSNNILYAYNKQISLYKDALKQSKTFIEETELLSLQTSSLSGVLKEFASSYSKTLPFFADQEKIIAKALHKNGIVFSELMIFGEEDDMQVYLVLEKTEYDSKNLVEILSSTLPFAVIPEKVINVSLSFVAVCYKKAPLLDAVFGISQRAKDNGDICGDTHSLLKLGAGKFVVAINDGMGSGKKANAISGLSCGLIESFFKAGLNSDLVLKTVNKILAITSTDSFTALDLAIIDLYKGFCEFIKIGSPYGYIIERDGIKIVEASSLPLGTIEEIDFKPAKTNLLSGDMLVLVSDGVADAFGSSTDVLDYLKTLNTLNPQNLADSIVNKACELDITPKDDMTALCVKIYQKAK